MTENFGHLRWGDKFISIIYFMSFFPLTQLPETQDK
jgi:hypothetical protein